MSRTNTNIPDVTRDQRVADIRSKKIDFLRDEIGSQVRKECDLHEEIIAGAWAVIQNEISTFEKKKAEIFEALADVEGQELARLVVAPELQGMVPASYQAIRANTPARSPRPSYNTPLTSPREMQCQPVADMTGAQPSTSASLDPGADSCITATRNGNGAGAAWIVGTPKLKLTAKRTRPSQKLSPAVQKKAKTKETVIQTKKEPVADYDVEGKEFIFQYPPFGPGWFVLRCDFGPYAKLGEGHFTTHPFEAETALEHFNGCKTCRGHDTSRTYEADDIVMEYGHRVIGEDINEAWVEVANTRLKTDMAKAKGKNKIRQPDLRPANRSVTTSATVYDFVE